MRPALVLLLCLLTTSTGFLTCEVQERMVSYPLSSTAVLPCLFRPSRRPADELLRVSWQKEHEMEDLVVHFQNGKDRGDKQNEVFKGRTGMSKNWFLEGNATLTLGRLTHDDAGKYTCWVTAYPIRPGQQRKCCVVMLTIYDQSTKQKITSHGDDGGPSPLDQAVAYIFILLVFALFCFVPIFLTNKRYSRSWSSLL
ncbi:CD276 antigen-like [Anomaloglossus baeobatrachus]